jgi:hypothetical protein
MVKTGGTKKNKKITIVKHDLDEIESGIIISPSNDEHITHVIEDIYSDIRPITPVAFMNPANAQYSPLPQKNSNSEKMTLVQCDELYSAMKKIKKRIYKLQMIYASMGTPKMKSEIELLKHELVSLKDKLKNNRQCNSEYFIVRNAILNGVRNRKSKKMSKQYQQKSANKSKRNSKSKKNASFKKQMEDIFTLNALSDKRYNI